MGKWLEDILPEQQSRIKEVHVYCYDYAEYPWNLLPELDVVNVRCVCPDYIFSFHLAQGLRFKEMKFSSKRLNKYHAF
jgi:hypothetical protein